MASSCGVSTVSRSHFSTDLQKTLRQADQRGDYVRWIIEQPKRQDVYDTFHKNDPFQIIREILDIGPIPIENRGEALVSILSSSDHEKERIKIADQLLDEGGVLASFASDALHLAIDYLEKGHLSAIPLIKKILSEDVFDEDRGRALISLLKIPLPDPKRSELIEKLLENGSIPKQYLGQGVNIAVQQLDCSSVRRLLQYGSIPEADDQPSPAVFDQYSEKPISQPDSWQEAIQSAMQNNAHSIVEALLATPSHYPYLRSRNFYRAFRQYVEEGGDIKALDRWLDSMPNRREVQQICINFARKNHWQEMLDELEVFEARDNLR